MQDLAAYMAVSDFTLAARNCNRVRDFEPSVACFEELGMTNACAKLWVNNADKILDFKVCGFQCILLTISQIPLNEKPPECKLNACLACDDEKIAPFFNKFGGRGRRNSGLLSAIGRKSSEIASITHELCPDTTPLPQE